MEAGLERGMPPLVLPAHLGAPLVLRDVPPSSLGDNDAVEVASDKGNGAKGAQKGREVACVTHCFWHFRSPERLGATAHGICHERARPHTETALRQNEAARP